jgi:hypothetical protein
LQVPTDKASICNKCSTYNSNMSSPDDIFVWYLQFHLC